MHQLVRQQAQLPCLARYRHGRDQWSYTTPTQVERGVIWDELNAMQGHRCAYCEGSLTESNRHIEHFRQRDRYPQGTFDWTNLFGSCDREESCGKHKDKCGAYPPGDLIKCDVEDPERFLVFTPNGNVSARAGLSPTDAHRANETIRIFNLNGVLKHIRKAEVAGYIQTAEDFATMATFSEEHEWLPMLQEEVNNTSHLPYATAIKHVLTRQS